MEEGQKLIRYLEKLMPKASISFLYKMLRKKNIKLNDKRAFGNEVLKDKDDIKIFFSDETFKRFENYLSKVSSEKQQFEKKIKSKEDILNSFYHSKAFDKLDILYEDEDILVLNKPAGMLSQKSKRDDISINELAIKYLLDEGKITVEKLKTFKPSVINRLDRNTSGIILFGKTMKGLKEGARLLLDKSLKKSYICAVKGEYKRNDGILKGYLLKDDEHNKVKYFDHEINGGKYMEEEVFKIFFSKKISILKVILHTGRSHQIRCSLSAIGYPVAGDLKYGDKSFNKLLLKEGIKYQLLHSYEITYKNKIIKAKLPNVFERIKNGDLEFQRS